MKKKAVKKATTKRAAPTVVTSRSQAKRLTAQTGKPHVAKQDAVPTHPVQPLELFPEKVAKIVLDASALYQRLLGSRDFADGTPWRETDLEEDITFEHTSYEVAVLSVLKSAVEKRQKELTAELVPAMEVAGVEKCSILGAKVSLIGGSNTSIDEKVLLEKGCPVAALAAAKKTTTYSYVRVYPATEKDEEAAHGT